MKKLSLVILIVMVMSMVHAQNNRLIIDLSHEKKYEQTIETGKLDTIWIVNRLVDSTYSYTFSVKKTRIAQGPFDLPSTTAVNKAIENASDSAGNKFLSVPCRELLGAINKMQHQ